MQVECPICLAEFLRIVIDYSDPGSADHGIVRVEHSQDHLRCIIPCSTGHFICFQCLTTLYVSHPAGSGKCWLLGKECPPHRRHTTCPVCEEVFHVRDDDLTTVLVIENEYDLSDINSEKISNLLSRFYATRDELLQRVDSTRRLARLTIIKLLKIQSQFDQHITNTRIAKLTGASVSAAGGVMLVVGGVLSIMTMGAFLPVMIAGGVVSAAGSAAAGGSTIASLVITKDTKTEVMGLVNRLTEEYIKAVDLLQELRLTSSVLIVEIVGLFGNLGGVANTITRVIQLAVLGTDTAGNVLMTLFRIGTLAGRALGIALAGVMIVVDLGSIIYNTLKLATNERDEFSVEIDNVVTKIQAECVQWAYQTERILGGSQEEKEEFEAFRMILIEDVEFDVTLITVDEN